MPSRDLGHRSDVPNVPMSGPWRTDRLVSGKKDDEMLDCANPAQILYEMKYNVLFPIWASYVQVNGRNPPGQERKDTSDADDTVTTLDTFKSSLSRDRKLAPGSDGSQPMDATTHCRPRSKCRRLMRIYLFLVVIVTKKVDKVGKRARQMFTRPLGHFRLVP
ncbi:hypothetical protein SODALDRAFT_351586 [Sodiomyces alkalinus F11]|uniref:Uncharacterized protein n=1 Tax=Sodiomyces alkalinus (strain CBS 110278 / VKM F-3762 / F11) TaxID=1314773 RepID=A0A3N2PSF9_SODAK|nr:hypothetical protein SODALDRAFT_351586 [Sodiomyces alkalinus F11]ROT37266.1 hypothetical protein SODALDRAFT_351586 [Sodiomyces alkalinus F11]